MLGTKGSDTTPPPTPTNNRGADTPDRLRRPRRRPKASGEHADSNRPHGASGGGYGTTTGHPRGRPGGKGSVPLEIFIRDRSP
ncbi:hypothetical protein ARUL111621_12400 [Arthrobacter ulcerisalmonis]